MRLNINDGEHLETPTAADVEMRVEHLAVDQFLVLTSEPGHFVQTYHKSDGCFELERREGSSQHHYAVNSSTITIDDVKKAFGLFLRQSADLASSWNWQQLSFGPEVDLVDEEQSVSSDALVEYHGVLMSADWPQEIEDAQELRDYVMRGQRLGRVVQSEQDASDEGASGEHSGLCQECGVRTAQFHVPGCRHEQCPRCQGKLVECSCEIDID